MFVIFIVLLISTTLSVQAADKTINDAIEDVSSVDYSTQKTTVTTEHPDINVDNIDIIKASYTQQAAQASVSVEVRGSIENRGKIIDQYQGSGNLNFVEYDFQLTTSVHDYSISYSNRTGQINNGINTNNLTSSDFSVVGNTLTISFALTNAAETYSELSVTSLFVKMIFNGDVLDLTQYVYLTDIAPNPALEIMEAYAPNGGSVGETIQFNGSLVPLTGQPPYEYHWDFGDQGTSTQLNPTHVYTKAGTFTYTFTVTDQADDSDSETRTITISGQPLSADFIWTPTNPNPGQTITFDASKSYPDVSITLYEWNWNNDGVYEESSSTPIATHSWSQVGNYLVAVRVTDNSGDTDTMAKIVNVGSGDQSPGTNNKFVGKWDCLGDEGNSFYHEITFYADGLVELFHRTLNGGFSNSGTWESNDTTLTIYIVEDGDSSTRPFRYTFTNSETLILSPYSGDSITYKSTTNPSASTKTPGFELVFVLCAIAVALFLWRKKRSI